MLAFADDVSNVVDLYNTATGVWTTARLSVGRSNPAAASVGDVAMFAGGNAIHPNGVVKGVVSNAVDIYNSTTGFWTTARLSMGRGRLAAASVGNMIIVAGGYTILPSSNPGFQASDAVDLYHCATRAWTTVQLSLARYDLAAASVGNVAIFAGGVLTGGAFKCSEEMKRCSDGCGCFGACILGICCDIACGSLSSFFLFSCLPLQMMIPMS